MSVCPSRPKLDSRAEKEIMVELSSGLQSDGLENRKSQSLMNTVNLTGEETSQQSEGET